MQFSCLLELHEENAGLDWMALRVMKLGQQDYFEGIVATHIPGLNIPCVLWGFLKKDCTEPNQEAYNYMVMMETRLSLDTWSSGLMHDL
jgi:hypothetical protein